MLAAEESESRAGVEGMDEHLHVTIDADSKVAQARVVVENLDALRVRVVAHRKRLLQARSKLPDFGFCRGKALGNKLLWLVGGDGVICHTGNLRLEGKNLRLV